MQHIFLEQRNIKKKTLEQILVSARSILVMINNIINTIHNMDCVLHYNHDHTASKIGNLAIFLLYGFVVLL